MRKAIFGLLFTLLALQSYGANWFVRAGASGSNNGADWNNAWSSFSQIGWASLQPGDTIYVAAGTYGQLALGKSGTTAAPITLKRAFVGDIGATSAPGWNAATMDGRVVITAPNNGDGIILGTGSGIHYFTIDGGPGALQDQNSKFLVNFGYGTNPSGSGVWSGNSPTDHIILRNITCWDAGSKTAPQSGPVRGYDITGSPLKSDYTLQYCESGGGGDQNIFMGYAGGTFNNILVEHCVFRDSGTTNVGNVAGGDGFHPNAWSNGPAQNMTIRYCRVFNMTVEGIFFNYDVTNGWCYDNVIYQGPIGSQSGARAFECSNVGTYNNLNIYNNTIVGLPLGARLDNAGSIVNCRFANNIVWNSGHSFAGWMVDHNCLDGADPFLDSAAFDYHLKAGSPAKGRGAKLGAKYAPDMDGVTRGQVWDAGAYAAVQSAFTPMPTPSPTPTPTRTPSPTPTPPPAPTPTPTPTPTPSPSPTATPSSTPKPTPTATPTPGSTPKFVQGAFKDPHTATSIRVHYSGGQTGGNLNVVVVGWNDSTAQVSSVKDSAGNAYQLAVGPTKLAAAGGLNQSIYYAKNIAASGANTVTVTFNQTAHYPDVRILEYSGIDRTNPVDVIAAQTQSSGASCTSGNVATTNPTDLLVAANTIQTFTAGSGATFTERVHSNPDGQIAEDRVVTTAGLYSAGATLSSPGAWVMQMVAFRNAAGSQPAPSPTPTPSPSTPKFVQAAYGDPQPSAASIPIRYSGAQTGGNLNVVVVGWNDTIAQVSSVKDSAGNAYQLAVGPTKLAAAGGLNQSIYYAKNIAASGANTVTVTFNQTAHYPDVRILEYSGIDRTNPVDVIAAQTQSSGAICTSGNVATTNPTDLLVAANTIQTFTAAPDANFTERVHSNPDGQIVEDRVVATAGLYSAGAALSSPGAWVMQMVAFRAAGSQPSTTASAQTTLTQNLAGMNGLCPSGLPIAPAVRSWLLDERKLIKFGGPELDRPLGMAAHSELQQHNGSLLFPGRGAA